MPTTAPLAASRRSVRVLAIALAFLLPLTLAAPVLAQQRSARPVPDSKISVQLWTVRDLMNEDPAGTLQAIADIGYRNVEPFSFHGLSATEFKAALDAAGLRAPSLHTDINSLRNNLDRVIADAKTIGARQVSLAWVSDEWRTPEGVAELADILNEVGAELRRNGIQLGYHNHDFEFTTMVGDQTMFDYLIDNTQRRWVDFQLDLYWVAAGGVDPVTVIRENRNRITTVHVKDRAPDGSFANVGQGTLDFGAMFRESPFRLYIVENDAPGADPLGAIETSYNYLRNFRY